MLLECWVFKRLLAGGSICLVSLCSTEACALAVHPSFAIQNSNSPCFDGPKGTEPLKLINVICGITSYRSYMALLIAIIELVKDVRRWPRMPYCARHAVVAWMQASSDILDSDRAAS